MTNKTIYGCTPFASDIDNKYHYVYRITNLVEGKHYYGSRTSSVLPRLDLGSKYFGQPSGKTNEWIKTDQKENSTRYKYKILRCFNTRKEANVFEEFLHSRFDVKEHDKFYNEVNSSQKNSIGFNPVDMRYVINSSGEKFYTSKHDQRIKSGELIYPNTGTVVVKCKDGKNKRVSVDDKLIGIEYTYINAGRKGQEYQKSVASQISKDTIPVVDLEGKIYRIPAQKFDKNKHMHVATRKVLFKTEDGKQIWSNRFDPSFSSAKILYENKTDKQKFYYHTPWGIYNNLQDAFFAKNIDISFQNLKMWCKWGETTKIVARSILGKLDPQAVNKTYKELGFYRTQK